VGSTLKRELIGIALLLFSVFLAGALVAFAASTLRGGVDVRHSVGFVGYYLAYPVVAFFGWPAAALVPAVPAVHALRLFGRLESETDRSWMIFLAGVVVLLPVAVGISVSDPRADDVSRLAGIWGGFVAYYWRAWFGGFGAWVVLLLAASALTAVTLRWNPVRMIVGRRAPIPTLPAAEIVAAEAPYSPPKRRRKKEPVDVALALEPPPEEFEALDALAALQASASADADAKEDAAIEEAAKRRGKKKEPTRRDDEIAAAIEATETPELTSDELPPSELLNAPPPKNADLGRRELDAMGVKLMDALRTFKVEGELTGRTTGPVVTQFEVSPAPGVKVRQIANLSNDLALAMRAPSIRIVAPFRDVVPSGWKSRIRRRRSSVPRAHRAQRLSERARGASHRAGEGSRREARHRRSGEDAASADRRRNGLGQVGVREHDHHQPRVSGIRRVRCAS
jgi:S-DNA-T family DNA segregation ATPase FtsK/SpoIIIE